MGNIFGAKVKYYKNGQWFWTKMLARTVGENRYNTFRLERRIASNTFYYYRQQALYKFYVDYPDIANSIGLFSKMDVSHGFMQMMPYEAFRDFQENTINSEGWFAAFVYIVCGLYSILTLYAYVFPYYFYLGPTRKDEFVILRIRDYYASTAAEEVMGNQLLEMVLTPHWFHRIRKRWMSSYTYPDEARLMFFTSFNRPHKYREHYMQRAGDSNSMLSAI